MHPVKTVLMIDNEPLMIDRRIILEAQTLISAGYHVILLTKRNNKASHHDNDRGLEIRRFPLNEDSKELTYQNHLNRVLHWHRTATLGPKDSFKSVLRNPENFAPILAKKAPWLKRLFGKTYVPLCLLLIRPNYLGSYFKILQWRLKNKCMLRFNWYDSTSKEMIHFAKKCIKPDYIHAHDLPNLKMGRDLARHFSIPLIYDAHELYASQFFSSEALKKRLAKREKQLIYQAQAVITVNQQCIDVMRTSYPNIKTIIDLSNATELPKEPFPEEKDKLWHKQFNLAPEVKLMVFQGGINPVRNIDPLLRALHKVPDHLHIGFITFKKDIPYYEHLSKELGIYHRIHYVCELPWFEVNKWLMAADVGVMPYQATSLNVRLSSPNKLYEFVIAGLPIIASNELINVKHAIETYHLGVCKLLKEDDTYVDAIKAMFDEALGGPQRFVENVKSVRHLFSWDNEAPKLLELYSKISKA